MNKPYTLIHFAKAALDPSIVLRLKIAQTVAT